MSRAIVIEKPKKAMSKREREKVTKEIKKMLIQAHKQNPEPEMSEEEIAETLKESRKKTFAKFYGPIPQRPSSSKTSKR